MSNEAKRAALSVSEKGFTLVELAMVLVIVGLLVGGLLMTLSAQHDATNTRETEARLNEIRDALIGFAAQQQRLPCPATATSGGNESPPGGGACTANHAGFVPAVTLGLAPTDAQGYALDAWGNRIRYAVTRANSNVFTSANGLRAAWAATSITPDLVVCSTAANISDPEKSSADCPPAERLTARAVVVAIVMSPGKNGGATPTSADELANWTTSDDRVFVNPAPNPAFDDRLLWLSSYILYNRLIAAGRLP
jgi:prepilin-type N-terminal cleavage/methylation domain-containing protein